MHYREQCTQPTVYFPPEKGTVRDYCSDFSVSRNVREPGVTHRKLYFITDGHGGNVEDGGDRYGSIPL